MPRPVTLFTGQWADLPLDELAPLAKQMGYDGVELACWGDHFDVDARRSRSQATSTRSGRCSSDHGLAVLRDLEPPRRPGGLRPDRRAAQGDPPAGRLGRRRAGRRAPARRRRDRPAHAPRRRRDVRRRRRERLHRLEHLALASTPSRRPARTTGTRASRDFAKRWTPILDEFDKRTCTSRSKCIRPRSPSTSPRPSARSRRSKSHKRFGFNYDPSHLGYQGVDYVKFIRTLRPSASSTRT